MRYAVGKPTNAILPVFSSWFPLLGSDWCVTLEEIDGSLLRGVISEAEHLVSWERHPIASISPFRKLRLESYPITLAEEMRDGISECLNNGYLTKNV